MANYATLIAAIQSVITQNGNNEITGPILQQTLISVVNSLGSGYQFIGIATPETTPGTPDQKVFYIGASGTYPNFGPAVIPAGNLAVFYYDSSWHYGTVAFPLGDGVVSLAKLDEYLHLVYNMLISEDELNINSYPVRNYAVDANGDFVKNSAGTYRHTIIPVVSGQIIRVTANNNLRAPLAWFTNDSEPVLNADAPLVPGTSLFYVQPGETDEFVVPSGAKFLYVFLGSTPNFTSKPASISQIGFNQDLFAGIEQEIQAVKDITIKEQTIDPLNYPLRDYGVNPTGVYAQGTTVEYKHVIIPVFPGQIIRIVANPNYNTVFAWFINNSLPILGESAPIVPGTSRYTQPMGTTEEYTVPAGSRYLYVFLNVEPTFSYKPESIVKIGDVGLEYVTDIQEITISPEFELGAFSPTGTFAGSAYAKKYWRTKFINCIGVKRITLTKASNRVCRIAFYDENGKFIGTYTIDAGITTKTIYIDNANYLNLTVGSALDASSVDIPRPVVSLTGNFNYEYEAFAPKPDNNYLRLIIPVNVANPNASDNDSATLQDSQNLMYDYGLIAFPDSYSMNGRPTRLIIYCHGAGVNYDTNISQFPDTDLRPEYWLSEGYAVMDIEGNPFNNTDEHFYIPQAIQSYLAAYDWVVRMFNISKDGILLGGRSMGGGMCFEIMQSRIPVIAACPVVPCCNQLWIWEWMNAARRQFVAQKMGFTGTAPTWTGNRPMSTAEWNYLQSNFNKLVKYSPFWRGIDSLPNKETLFGVGNVGPYASNPTEATLYNGLHFKTNRPIKIFAARDDDVVNNERNCDLMYQMLLNAAQVCELRYFPTGGHHFELAAANILSSFVNSFGVTLTNVPIAYIEILQFWRRYELNY